MEESACSLKCTTVETGYTCYYIVKGMKGKQFSDSIVLDFIFVVINSAMHFLLIRKTCIQQTWQTQTHRDNH